MTGLEVPGLLFGVLPIFIEAIKAYSTICEKVHTFRYCSREVRSIDVQFQVERRIFLNECQLLLRLITDDVQAKEMVEDGQHPLWNDETINERMNSCLQNNYKLCQSIIENTQITLEEIGEEISSLELVKASRAKVSALPKISCRREP